MLQPALHVNPAALPTVQPPSTADVKAVLQRVRAALPALALQVVPFARSLRVETLSGAAVGLTVHWFKGAWVATVWTPSGKFELSAADAHTLLATLPILVVQAQADAYDTDLLHAPGLTVRCFHNFTWHDVPAPESKTMTSTITSQQTLTADQQHVASLIRKTISDTVGRTLLIRGYAGTGKTFTLLSVLAHRSDIIYVAPTHMAKNVINQVLAEHGVQVEACTLARALGAAHGYDLYGDSVFTYSPKALEKMLAETKASALVLDEGSMVSGGLFELLRTALGFGLGGARVLEHHSAIHPIDSAASHEFSMAIYERKTCPETGNPVESASPRRDNVDEGTSTFTWWSNTRTRRHVHLIVMGDPAQLPPIYTPIAVSTYREGVDVSFDWCLRHNLTTITSAKPKEMGSGAFSEPHYVVTRHDVPTLQPRNYDYNYELSQVLRSACPNILRVVLDARHDALCVPNAHRKVRPHHTGGGLSYFDAVNIPGTPEGHVADLAAALYRQREDVVVLAYTNAVVQSLAKEIRGKLLPANASADMLHAGEPIMFHAPYAVGQGRRLDNGDMVYVTAVMARDTRSALVSELIKVPKLEIPFDTLLVRRLRDGLVAEVRVLREANRRELRRAVAQRGKMLHELLRRCEEVRAQVLRGVKVMDDGGAVDDRCISARISMVESELDGLYRWQDSFADVASSYVRTIHKAQGGTWRKVIYMQDNVFGNDRGMLSYVAVSRAAQELVVVRSY